jgi:spore germination protein GerM
MTARIARFVLGAAVLAACGVPADNEARRLAAEEVPFQLTATTQPGSSTTVTTAPVVAGSAVLLYFVTETGLRALPVPVSPIPDELGVMELLAVGPPDDSGLRSVVQPGEVLSVVRDPEEDGRVVVDVGPTLVDLPASEQVLAIGQIVLTLTDRPGVRSVAFTSEGEAISVPRADGSIIEDAVRRADLIDLIG